MKFYCDESMPIVMNEIEIHLKKKEYEKICQKGYSPKHSSFQEEIERLINESIWFDWYSADCMEYRDSLGIWVYGTDSNDITIMINFNMEDAYDYSRIEKWINNLIKED